MNSENEVWPAVIAATIFPKEILQAGSATYVVPLTEEFSANYIYPYFFGLVLSGLVMDERLFVRSNVNFDTIEYNFLICWLRNDGLWYFMD